MADTRVRNTWLMASVIALVGALTTDCTPQGYPACRQDQDCKSALLETCIDGTCQNCTTNEDCDGMAPLGQEPFVCLQFRCQPEGGELAGGGFGPGEPCTERGQCSQDLACKGGVCSNCFEDIDCEPLTCNLGSGRCAPPGLCENDDQCPMDEICDGGMCVFGELGDGGDGGPCGLRAVFFAFDSDSLTSETEQELTSLAGCMKSESRTVYLEAHADNRGTEEYNILLTERRGTRVRRYLLDQGVDGEFLRVIAKGSLEATGVDEQSRAIDRRVQIVWQ